MNPSTAFQTYLESILAFLEGHQWVADPVAVVVTGLIAASMIIWQVGRQAKSAIVLQHEASRQGLKLEVYRHFDDVLAAAITSSGKAASDARTLSFNLHNTISLSRQGIMPYNVKYPAELYSDNDSRLGESIYRVLALLERYQIINPHLDLFNLAINSASHDIRNAHIEMYHEILKFIPTEAYFAKAAAAGFSLQIPTDDDLQRLDYVIDKYVNATDTYGCYIHDLNIALQNEMLGDLFKNKLAPRQPLSNKHKVVTLNPASYDDLKRYFWHETAWGKAGQRAEEDVLQEEAARLVRTRGAGK